MKAIALTPGTKNIRLVEKQEPNIKADDEIKLRVLEVGICGTDREEVSGGRAEAPEGEKDLIIGHEMLGEVLEVGKSVQSVKPKDLALFTVRRGCGSCPSCLADSPDMCYTENYKERGIKGLHGFQSQFVVDKEKYLFKVPESMRSYGVLSEPMSIVQKGIDEMSFFQKTRLPDWEDLKSKRILVAGLGPVGLLAVVALRLRGAEVFGFDIVDEGTIRPRVLTEMGGTYINGKKIASKDISKTFGRIDAIIEAAGIPSLDFDLMEDLETNGAYVFLGVTRENLSLNIDGGTLMKKLVLENQVFIGSVNAGKRHWQQGIDDLEQAGKRWPLLLPSIITHRIAYTHFEDVLSKHPEGEIKAVISWT